MDDASNQDVRFARNRLRSLWPAWLEAFPEAEQALSAAARRAAQDAACLDALAQLDLPALRDGDTLSVERWVALEPARRANALRAWLRACMGRGASETLVERLLEELPRGKAPARWLAEAGELRRYRGRLAWAPAPAQEEVADVALLCVEGPGVYAVPAWRGRLHVQQVASGGIALSMLRQLRLQPRGGGEQFQRTPRGVARALAPDGVPQATLRWQPDDLAPAPRETP